MKSVALVKIQCLKIQCFQVFSQHVMCIRQKKGDDSVSQKEQYAQRLGFVLRATVGYLVYHFHGGHMMGNEVGNFLQYATNIFELSYEPSTVLGFWI